MRPRRVAPAVARPRRPSPSFFALRFASSRFLHPASPLIPPPAPLPRDRPTVFEMVKTLPDWGVGAKVAKGKWKHCGAENSFWTITRVRPRTSRSGKVWGNLTWKGEEKEDKLDVRIPHAYRPGIWKVIESAREEDESAIEEDEDDVEAPALTLPASLAGEEFADRMRKRKLWRDGTATLREP